MTAPAAAALRQLQREARMGLEAALRSLYCLHAPCSPASFDAHWLHGLGPEGGWEVQRKLAIRLTPPRRHVWDFVHRTLPLAVEVNGGQARGARSGHGSWTGLARDAEKAQLAILAGYWPVTITTSMLQPREAAATIARLRAIERLLAERACAGTVLVTTAINPSAEDLRQALEEAIGRHLAGQ